MKNWVFQGTYVLLKSPHHNMGNLSSGSHSIYMFFRQLRLLLWKNAVLKKRTPVINFHQLKLWSCLILIWIWSQTINFVPALQKQRPKEPHFSTLLNLTKCQQELKLYDVFNRFPLKVCLKSPNQLKILLYLPYRMKVQRAAIFDILILTKCQQKLKRKCVCLNVFRLKICLKSANQLY